MGPKVKWLDQCRIIDFTDELGGICGWILAQLGADVIKIEKLSGATERRLGPFYKNIPDPERSLYWLAFNAGKRGITLNIETSDGQDIFRKLANTADIVLESFQPGYMDNLDLGYRELSKINPRLVYTSITHFGQEGPYRSFAGCDLVTMALSGLLYVNGVPDRSPVRFSIDQAYCQAGLHAAAGTMLAHYHASQTGWGQHVDCSAQEALVMSLFDVIPLWDLNRIVLTRQGNKIMRWKYLQRVAFRCKDGQVSWRFLTSVRGDRTRALVNWMLEEGMAEGLDQVKWESIDFDDVTQEEACAWEAIFEKFFLTKTKSELSSEGNRRGIMVFPMQNVADVCNSEQLKARDFWTKLDHEDVDKDLLYPGIPFKTLSSSDELLRRAPHIGEHNLQIYRDELGMTDHDLVLLRQAGVL